MKRNLSSEEQHRRMIETPMPKLVTSMALPTVASQLVTVLYNTADTFFVSQIGTSAAAAVGVVFSLMSIIQAVGFGLGMGANSLVSRCLGAKKDGDACRYASSAFAAALVFGLLLMIGGLLVMEPLMRSSALRTPFCPTRRTMPATSCWARLLCALPLCSTTSSAPRGRRCWP